MYECNDIQRSSVLSWAENSFIYDHFTFNPKELAILSKSSVYPEDTMYILIASSIDYLISISNNDYEIFDNIISRIHYILAGMFHLKIKDLQYLAQNRIKFYQVLDIFVMRFTTIKKEMLPSGISTFLDNHLNTRLKDLLEKTEYELFAQFGLSSDSLYLLHGLQALPELYNRFFSPYLGLFLRMKKEYKDYETFLKSWISPLLNNKSHSDMLFLRLFCKKKKFTLENLAEKFSLSRERIRQIIKRSASILSQEKSLEIIQPLWNIINSIAQINGFISISRLALQINRVFEWDDGISPDCLKNLMDLNPRLNTAKCECMINSECIIYSKQNKCCRCTEIIPVFLSVIEKEKIIRSENLAKIMYRISSSNCPYCGPHIYSRDFCIYLYLSNKASMKNIVLRDSVFYTRQSYKLYKSSIKSSIDFILRKSRKPMSINEIYHSLSRLKKKNVSFAKVRNVIYSSSDFLTWERGRYIHAERLNSDLDSLDNIETYIISELEKRKGMLSIRDIFKLFSAECRAERINNPYALYSCLKYRANPCIKYPLFPNITL